MRSLVFALTLVVWFIAFIPYIAASASTLLESPSRRRIPIALQGRQLTPNTTAPNSYGISPVSLSSDKQTYYVVLQAGQISFRAALDTGSSDLWLMSTDCSSKTCSSVPRYPLSYDSPTYVPVNNNATAFNVSYADGTGASGFVARETFEVANVTVANQAFGVVTASNVTMDDDVSGILGLGFARLSQIYYLAANATPFIGSLSERGILDYPIFGLSLTWNATGTLSIGAVDVSIVQNTSNIVWNEVVPFSPLGIQANTSGYFYWAIHMTSFAINNTVLTPIPTYPGPTDNSSIALLDVGTSGLYGPYQDVTRLFALFPGSRLVDTSGQWVVPCDSSAIMSFSFGEGNTFVLQPSDYLMGPVAGNTDLCLSWPKALPPSADGVDWQLGTPFLRTVYSIYSYGIDDEEPPMIGLYPRNNASAPVESYAALEAFFSAQSANIATTLPNYPLATPTYSTPAYAFNTSVAATFGEIVFSELATSTYVPIVGTQSINASALPKVSDAFTFVVTEANGAVITSTYHVSQPSVALGVPPGWSGAGMLGVPGLGIFWSLLLTLAMVICMF
ncbi:aspartic peptidase A1 [Hygrophoropsis aurantiaca]|uniref:Aspartic peptidase A1 n=1 Tax=Hygrophoropsis aurantiaca TaxID=72124 RepID=A0ACB8AIL8_9AGAM|nr:aspartic peptidase A1 [Hygrophoropsis aurantiaca]